MYKVFIKYLVRVCTCQTLKDVSINFIFVLKTAS